MSPVYSAVTLGLVAWVVAMAVIVYALLYAEGERCADEEARHA